MAPDGSALSKSETRHSGKSNEVPFKLSYGWLKLQKDKMTSEHLDVVNRYQNSLHTPGNVNYQIPHRA